MHLDFIAISILLKIFSKTFVVVIPDIFVFIAIVFVTTFVICTSIFVKINFEFVILEQNYGITMEKAQKWVKAL